jgi:hypothetical protein
MKITDRTIAKVNLTLLASTFAAVAWLAWHASALSMKVETLWADYLHRVSAVASLSPSDKE